MRRVEVMTMEIRRWKARLLGRTGAKTYSGVRLRAWRLPLRNDTILMEGIWDELRLPAK